MTASKAVSYTHLNEAAKQLFITQPSLSNAVRDLENEMGIEIFIRNPKGITLTRDGMAVSYTHLDVYKRQAIRWGNRPFFGIIKSII